MDCGFLPIAYCLLLVSKYRNQNSPKIPLRTTLPLLARQLAFKVLKQININTYSYDYQLKIVLLSPCSCWSSIFGKIQNKVWLFGVLLQLALSVVRRTKTFQPDVCSLLSAHSWWLGAVWSSSMPPTFCDTESNVTGFSRAPHIGDPVWEHVEMEWEDEKISLFEENYRPECTHSGKHSEVVASRSLKGLEPETGARSAPRLPASYILQEPIFQVNFCLGHMLFLSDPFLHMP